MDWSLVIAVAALAVTALGVTITYADLDETKRAWLNAFWSRALNWIAVAFSLGFSILNVVAFWLSHGPINRSSVITLGLHFFNLGIWSFLPLLSKGADHVMAERSALRARVSLLEAQVQTLTSPPRDR